MDVVVVCLRLECTFDIFLFSDMGYGLNVRKTVASFNVWFSFMSFIYRGFILPSNSVLNKINYIQWIEHKSCVLSDLLSSIFRVVTSKKNLRQWRM